MKVKELIKALRRMDQEAQVAWQAHDQSDDELDGWVERVDEACEALESKEGVGPIVVLT